MTFGEELREKRKEKGMTQDTLAEVLGVSRQAVAKWEAGVSFPSTENLLVLRELLGIVPDKKELAPEPAAELLAVPQEKLVVEGRETPVKKNKPRRGSRVLVALAVIAAFWLGYMVGLVYEGREENLLDSQVAAIVENMDMEQVLEYVETMVETSRDENRFCVCAARLLGYDESHMYLCVYTSNYHKASLGISPTGGSVFAVVLDVKFDGETVTITGFSVPEDGVDYGRSLSKIFPESLRDQIHPSEEELAAMEAEALARAKVLFESQT